MGVEPIIYLESWAQRKQNPRGSNLFFYSFCGVGGVGGVGVVVGTAVWTYTH